MAAYHSIFQCKRALKADGVYVVVPNSVARMFQALFLGPSISMAGRRTMGIHMGRPFDKADVAFLKELIEAGKVATVIDRRYPLSDVPEALRYQEMGRTPGEDRRHRVRRRAPLQTAAAGAGGPASPIVPEWP